MATVELQRRKATVYFLKSGDALDREAIFLEVKYDDLYHCLISRDHGQVYVQLTKKAVNSTSGVSMPGPSHQKPMVSRRADNAATVLPGPQGLLPRYSGSQAEGQEILLKLTDNLQDEFGDALDREAIFLEVKYDDLYHCLISRDHGQVYVQLTKKAVNSTSGVSMPGPSHQKPMDVAVRLCQEINYAKSLFYEQQLMLRSGEHHEHLELDS
ncbi:hypothetical protein E2320_006124 [Naja naja]|nr:hypothetical protein E2320_006124 [Naja naja]